MRTLVSDPPPPEFEALLKRRRRLGLDRRDEVWKGVRHMNPAPRGRHGDVLQQLAELLGPPARQAGLFPLVADFNLGDADDYRIPMGASTTSAAISSTTPRPLWRSRSSPPTTRPSRRSRSTPSTRSDELLIVDPTQRTVDWLALEQGEYRAIDRSRLIDLGPAQLAQQIDWP